MEDHKQQTTDESIAEALTASNGGLASSESKYREAITYQLGWIPGKYRGPWIKAHEGKSKANAIKAKCQDCVGWELPVENIGKCTSYSCPLWMHRPYQQKDND